MRLEGWGRWLTPRRDADAEVRAFARAMEHDLAELEYEEVTAEDRATFVEAVVEQEMRRALARGRFDLALRLRSYGRERVRELFEGRSQAGG